MKRWLVPAAAAALLAAGWLSVARVPEGAFAVAGGRVLDPGWHAKAPWSRTRVYPERAAVSVRLSLLTREGARKEGEVRAEVAWDPERLARNPVPPEAPREALTALTEYPADGGLRRALEERLASLPLRVLSLSTDIEGELPEAVRAAYRPTGRRVVFCGLDALDWILVDRLIGEGRMPTFARLKREGAWADLASAKPLLSPLLWTSIATSRPPDQHGVLDFIVRDPATGKDAPITSHYRKVQAFWNILSAFRLRTSVVGWWATFPAERIRGTMVTERLFFSLFGIEPPKLVPGNTYPPDAEARLAPAMVRAEQVPFDEVGRFVDLDRGALERRWEAGVRSGDLHGDRVNHLRKILASTHSVLNTTRVLLKEPFDVLAYYIEGTDTAAHRFAEFLPPRRPRVSEEDFRAFHDTLPRFYRWMDAELGAMMREGPRDAVWIIASDHGFFTGEARPSSRPDDFGTGAPDWHRLTGVLVIAGPGVRPGKVENATIYDLIPTLFHCLGVPASREMKGRALAEAFTFGSEGPRVDTYEFLPPPLRDPAPVALDEERMKELQALGYIGGAAQTAGRAQGPGAPTETVAADDFSKAYNLANTLYQRGDLEGAMAQYRRAVDLRPDFALGLYSLAQCYGLRGDHREAYAWLKRALRGADRPPEKTLTQLAAEAVRIGAEDEALAVLAAVGPAWQGEPLLPVAEGMLLAAKGDEDGAMRRFERARALDPSNAAAAEEILKRLAARRDLEAISRLLKETWDASRGSIQTMNTLGIVCLRHGLGRIAEEIFRQVLASDPDNGGVLANLAVALQTQGRDAEARAVFEQALRSQPDNAQLRFNYGAALLEAGRAGEALKLFLQARDRGLQGAKLHLALADAYQRLGRTAEARAVLDALLAAEPSNAEARRKLEALRARERR